MWKGLGVRGPTACGQKPLTLTLSLWERGQESMAKKVIRNRTSALPPAHRATPQRWAVGTAGQARAWMACVWEMRPSTRRV